MVVDKSKELAAVLGVFLALAWLFVSLRFYVKTFLSKSWGADDYILLISLASFTTYTACSATGVHYGTGRHLSSIPPTHIPRALYYWWLCELFYTITTVLIRVAIAVFLLRICVNRNHKWIIYATMTMMIGFSVFYFFLLLFQCSPVRFFWGQYEGVQGSCINAAAVPDASIAHSVVSFTADWVIGLLPILLLWNLKMNTRAKVSVAALLSLGLLAGVATLIRIPYIKVLTITDDFLFATTDVAIWSTVEAGLGLIAAGGATLRPLFRSLYNVSTNHSHHPYLSHNSKALRDFPTRSRGSVGNIARKSGRSSAESGSIGESVKLRGHSDRRGNATSIRSPFADSFEVDGGGFRALGSGDGGGFDRERESEECVIMVERTVEVSRDHDERHVHEVDEGMGRDWLDV